MKDKSLLFLNILFVFCAFSSIYSQVYIKPNIDDNKNWEIMYDEIPISNTPIVGVMNGNILNHNKSIDNYFYSEYEKSSTVTNLDVEISSIDGRYSGKLSFEIPPIKSDTILALEFPTKFFKNLQEYMATEIALKGSIVDDNASDAIPRYKPLSWFKEFDDNIIFLANTPYTIELFLINRDGQKIESYKFKQLKSSRPLKGFNKKTRVILTSGLYVESDILNFRLIERYKTSQKVKVLPYDFKL